MDEGHMRRFAQMLTNSYDLRAPIARGYGFNVAKYFTDALLVESLRESFYVPTDDEDIGRNLYMWRELDASLLHTAELIAQRGHAMKGRVFLDVGAGIGTTSVRAITRLGCSDVVSFECSHRHARLLRQNITLNGLEDRITPVLAAVSNPNQEMPNRATDVTERGEYDVATVRLDDWLEENAVDFERLGGVWIDVQGHEPDVLAGAPRLLASNAPVVCRFWPHRLNEAHAYQQMWEFLVASDRRVTDLGPPWASNVSVLATSDLPLLVRRYPGTNDFCDLLLLAV